MHTLVELLGLVAGLIAAGGIAELLWDELRQWMREWDEDRSRRR